MLTSIQKWGNSHGIRLPRYVLDQLGLRENEQVEIELRENSILIKKANNSASLDALFDGYDGEYAPQEYPWGEPRGKEVW